MVNKTKTIFVSSTDMKSKKKAAIPKALREQVWVQNVGNQFEHKCLVEWCQNTMNVFDYHVGHNIPESQGGPTSITNLKPICARCNLSMGSHYSIEEWSKIGQGKPYMKYKSIVPTQNVPLKKPWWLFCC